MNIDFKNIDKTKKMQTQFKNWERYNEYDHHRFITIEDLEYDVLHFCIDRAGKWWATSLLYNKEVTSLYNKLKHLNNEDIVRYIMSSPEPYDVAKEQAKSLYVL